jgi:hypothetical protein
MTDHQTDAEVVANIKIIKSGITTRVDAVKRDLAGWLDRPETHRKASRSRSPCWKRRSIDASPATTNRTRATRSRKRFNARCAGGEARCNASSEGP